MFANKANAKNQSFVLCFSVISLLICTSTAVSAGTNPGINEDVCYDRSCGPRTCSARIPTQFVGSDWLSMEPYDGWNARSGKGNLRVKLVRELMFFDIHCDVEYTSSISTYGLVPNFVSTTGTQYCMFSWGTVGDVHVVYPTVNMAMEGGGEVVVRTNSGQCDGNLLPPSLLSTLESWYMNNGFFAETILRFPMIKVITKAYEPCALISNNVSGLDQTSNLSISFQGAEAGRSCVANCIDDLTFGEVLISCDSAYLETTSGKVIQLLSGLQTVYETGTIYGIKNNTQYKKKIERLTHDRDALKKQASILQFWAEWCLIVFAAMTGVGILGGLLTILSHTYKFTKWVARVADVIIFVICCPCLYAAAIAKWLGVGVASFYESKTGSIEDPVKADRPTLSETLKQTQVTARATRAIAIVIVIIITGLFTRADACGIVERVGDDNVWHCGTDETVEVKNGNATIPINLKVAHDYHTNGGDLLGRYWVRYACSFDSQAIAIGIKCPAPQWDMAASDHYKAYACGPFKTKECHDSWQDIECIGWSKRNLIPTIITTFEGPYLTSLFNGKSISDKIETEISPGTFLSLVPNEKAPVQSQLIKLNGSWWLKREGANPGTHIDVSTINTVFKLMFEMNNDEVASSCNVDEFIPCPVISGTFGPGDGSNVPIGGKLGTLEIPNLNMLGDLVPGCKNPKMGFTMSNECWKDCNMIDNPETAMRPACDNYQTGIPVSHCPSLAIAVSASCADNDDESVMKIRVPKTALVESSTCGWKHVSIKFTKNKDLNEIEIDGVLENEGAGQGKTFKVWCNDSFAKPIELKCGSRSQVVAIRTFHDYTECAVLGPNGYVSSIGITSQVLSHSTHGSTGQHDHVHEGRNVKVYKSNLGSSSGFWDDVKNGLLSAPGILLARVLGFSGCATDMMHGTATDSCWIIQLLSEIFMVFMIGVAIWIGYKLFMSSRSKLTKQE